MARRLNDDRTQARATMLLAAGLVTQAEAARLAGVSRQTIMRWCRAAGIDAPKVRAARLSMEWRKADGRPKLGSRTRKAEGGET